MLSVADLEGAEPTSAPVLATDRRRHGTPDKWKQYCIMASAKFEHSTVKHALQNTQMIATSGFVTALESIKFVFWPARWGSLQHSPDPLAGLRGRYF